MRTAKLPLPIESADQVVEAIFAAASDRTATADRQPHHVADGRHAAGRADCRRGEAARDPGVHRRPARRGPAAAGSGTAGLRFLLRQLPQVAQRAVRQRLSVRGAAASRADPHAAVELGPAAANAAGGLERRVRLVRHAGPVAVFGDPGRDRLSGASRLGAVPPAHARAGPVRSPAAGRTDRPNADRARIRRTGTAAWPTCRCRRAMRRRCSSNCGPTTASRCRSSPGTTAAGSGCPATCTIPARRSTGWSRRCGGDEG